MESAPVDFEIIPSCSGSTDPGLALGDDITID
jgi:hypothetical protein